MKNIKYGSMKMFVVVILLILSLSACGTNGTSANSNKRTEEEKESVPKEFERMLGVVKSVDSVNSKTFVLDTDSEELIALNINGAVDLQDKFGSPITLAQLKVGDMVRVKYEVNSLIPETVQVTAEVWEYENVSGIIVDTENKTIKRANDTYEYTNELLVLYNNQPVNIEDITTTDKVTIKGYRNKAWVVILENGHGFIELTNYDYFVGGTLEIGFNTLEITEESIKTPVSVGVHQVVINKARMESVVREVMVEKDQVVKIDLSTDVPKAGQLKLTINESNARVYINGQRYDSLVDPINLSFGEYTIVAEKDGFLKFEEKISFNEVYRNYSIQLTKQSKYLHVNNPAGVELYLNGDYIGIIPVSIPVEAGKHSVTLRKDGYYSKLYNIEVMDDGKDTFFTFPDLVKMPENQENIENVNENNNLND